MFGGKVVKKSKQIVRVDQQSTKSVKVSRYDTKSIMSVVGIALGVIAFIAACVVIGYESFHVDPVMKVDDKKYYLSDPEVKFNVYMAEASLLNTGATYGAYYGMDAATYFESYKESAKSNALSSIEETYLMYNEAVKNGETLSDEDKSEVEEQYGKIYDKMSKTRIKRLDMTREEFIEQALHVKLAYQYMETVTEGFNVTKDTLTEKVEKSDYDERSFQVIQASLKTTDDEGNSVDVSSKDKETYTKQMKEYLKKAQKGTALDKIVDSKDSKTYVYAEKSVLTSDTTLTELMAKIKNMKDKEVYGSVIEADGSLWIVKMIDNDSTTQYDAAVEDAISAEKETKLQDKISELKESYNLTVEKGWDKVEIGTVAVYSDDSLDEFQADEEETEATATPAATSKATASPKASAKTSATPKATAKATATPKATK